MDCASVVEREEAIGSQPSDAPAWLTAESFDARVAAKLLRNWMNW
jgi:hypothetical protein